MQDEILEHEGSAACYRRGCREEQCREAYRAYHRAWNEANREKVRASQRAWYEANREKVRARRRALYSARKARGESRRPETGQEPPEHGKLAAYTHFACRCAECKRRMRDYFRERRQKEQAS